MWRATFFLCIIGFTRATEELNRRRMKELMASDRSGMIKFYQPWCGHSTRMKPDWDLLSEHFEEERSVFIADVNCQVEESLCSDYHTGGTYPTILVFPRGKDERPHAELYQGGRGFDDLRKFVDQRLVLPCDIRNDQETCSAKAQVYISKWRAKDRQAQHAELVRLRSMANEMTYELSKWVSDRIQILHQLVKQEESEL